MLVTVDFGGEFNSLKFTDQCMATVNINSLTWCVQDVLYAWPCPITSVTIQLYTVCRY